MSIGDLVARWLTQLAVESYFSTTEYALLMDNLYYPQNIDSVVNAPCPGRTNTPEVSRPEWFAAFLADRGTRKPSAETIKACC